jgi:hypothetical protein
MERKVLVKTKSSQSGEDHRGKVYTVRARVGRK